MRPPAFTSRSRSASSPRPLVAIIKRKRSSGVRQPCGPGDGAQTIISEGNSFRSPFGIALDAGGRILVADPRLGAVVAVDPLTGAQTIISQGGFFLAPLGITLDATDRILVAEPSAGPGLQGAVIAVDPVTGPRIRYIKATKIRAKKGTSTSRCEHRAADGSHAG
jgi:hypothetical protein